MIVSSTEYLKWEAEFVNDIRKLTPIGKWKSATFTIYSPDLRAWDLSNKWESLADGMVEAGYIIDDNWKYIPNVTLIYWGKTSNKKWVVNAIIQ